eukprot:767616-Hanusia_phi.AAC.5
MPPVPLARLPHPPRQRLFHPLCGHLPRERQRSLPEPPRALRDEEREAEEAKASLHLQQHPQLLLEGRVLREPLPVSWGGLDDKVPYPPPPHPLPHPPQHQRLRPLHVDLHQRHLLLLREPGVRARKLVEGEHQDKSSLLPPLSLPSLCLLRHHEVAAVAPAHRRAHPPPLVRQPQQQRLHQVPHVVASCRLLRQLETFQLHFEGVRPEAQHPPQHGVETRVCSDVKDDPSPPLPAGEELGEELGNAALPAVVLAGEEGEVMS